MFKEAGNRRIIVQETVVFQVAGIGGGLVGYLEWFGPLLWIGAVGAVGVMGLVGWWMVVLDLLVINSEERSTPKRANLMFVIH